MRMPAWAEPDKSLQVNRLAYRRRGVQRAARGVPFDGLGVRGRAPGEGTIETGEPDVKQRDEEGVERGLPVGIVIRGGEEPEVKPSIAAFIWGGKVRPVPTLPYGRWKPEPA